MLMSEGERAADRVWLGRTSGASRFEFGDLPFGLAVRARLDQRRHHRGKIGPDAVAK
jgi:hypothetical protein